MVWRNVLLMGATGRVGTLLRRYWQAHPPTRLRLQFQARPGHPDATPDGIKWQLSDGAQSLAQQLDRQPHDRRIDTILLLAGATQGADLAQNSALALATLTAAAASGVQQIFIASSSAIYGACPGLAHEETAAAPVTDYGHAKWEMEEACRAWARSNPAPQICQMRIGNVVGAGQFFDNMRRATSANPVKLDLFIAPDGQTHGPRRNHIGPATLAQVLETLCTQPTALPPALNIASPGAPQDMASFLPALAQHGQNVPVLRTQAPTTALPSLSLDTARLQAIHPFVPTDSDPNTMVGQWLALRGDRA